MNKNINSRILLEIVAVISLMMLAYILFSSGAMSVY